MVSIEVSLRGNNEYDQPLEVEEQEQEQLEEEYPAFGAVAVVTEGEEESETERQDDVNTKPSNFLRDPICPLWTKCTIALHKAVTTAVTSLALHAARYPITYIVSLTILSFVLLAAGFFVGFQLELDLAVIFTPVNSLPVKHSDWIASSNGFPDQVRNVQLVLHNEGKNVLHVAQTRRVLEAVDTIRTTPGFDELCSQGAYVDFEGQKTCRFLSASGYWNHNLTMFDTQIQNDQDLRTTISAKEFPSGSPILQDAILGNYEIDNDSQELTSAQSYLVLVDLPLITGETDAFETSMLERLDDLRQAWSGSTQQQQDETAPSSLEMDVFTIYAYKLEALRAIYKDMYLIVLCILLLIGCTCFVFYKRDKVQSRCLLGIASMVTITMSTLSGMGIMFAFGVPYSVVHQMLPFVIFGIGLDDTFIITGAFFRTPQSLPIEKRIQYSMEEVGWSIFITTLTTIFAFTLGYASSSYMGVHWLCLYAISIVSIDFLYQISYFVALMVLDERRIQAKRRDCCLWIVIQEENESSNGKKFGPDVSESNESGLTTMNADEESRTSRENASISSREHQSTNGHNNNRTIQNRNEETLSLPDKIMRWYANFLLQPKVQAIVLLLFTGYFAACCYSSTLIGQEFNVADYVPQDSYMKNIFSSLEEYSSVVRPMAVYFRNVDQTDPAIQQQMIDYIGELEALDQIGQSDISFADLVDSNGSSMTTIAHSINASSIQSFCWVRDFQLIQEHFLMTDTLDSSIRDAIEDMTFLQRLDLAMSDPRIRELYGQDIIRDDTGNITASRCYLFLRNLDLKDVQDQIEMLADQREVSSRQPINQGKDEWSFFAFDELFFYWEAYTNAVDELFFTIVAGIIAITAISFIFMPNYSAAIIVGPMILVLYVDLIGTFHFLGLSINGLTYVCVVVSIGLLVDFLIHILLRYYETTGKTRADKVKETLETMGVSILVGGFTTFLGGVPLAISSLEIFSTVFKGFFAMITLGLSHGLILLPVILSLVGPTKSVKGHLLPSLEYAMEEKTKSGNASSRPDVLDKRNTSMASLGSISCSSSDSASTGESPENGPQYMQQHNRTKH